VIGNAVVLGVALLVWGLVFFYLVRLERRIKELERK
jgi:CcmD family protein